MNEKTIGAILQERVMGLKTELRKIGDDMADKIDKYPDAADDIEAWWRDLQRVISSLDRLQ